MRPIIWAMALLAPDESVADAVSRAVNAPPRMGSWLVRKWCRGRMSAEEVLDGARSHIAEHPRDVVGDSLVARLARLNEHNAHRDMVRALSRRGGIVFPPLFWASIPRWHAHSQGLREERLPFYLPHELLSAFAAGGTDAWTSTTTELEEVLREWKSKVGFREQGPPLAALSVWGDTAAFNNNDSILLLLWGGPHWEQA